MISAREETWRYLSDKFPSLCFFFFHLLLCLFILHRLLVRALCLYSALLIHFGPCGRYIGSSQDFFFPFRFHFSASVGVYTLP